MAHMIGDESDQNFEKKITGDALAETDIFRNFVNLRDLGADYKAQNWKHDLVRLCFMLYTPSFGNSWKNENFVIG